MNVRRFVLGYLIVVGIASHVGVVALLWLVYAHYDLPPRVFAYRALRKLGFRPADPSTGRLAEFPSIDRWAGQGASPEWPGWVPRYDESGRPMVDEGREPGTAASGQRLVPVGTAEELVAAVEAAEAGDVIRALPGTYRIKAEKIRAAAGGSPSRPIIVRADRLGQVLLELDSLEGFLVLGPYWVFENLDIRGVCRRHDDCEHAFHVVGAARSTVIHNNRLRDFNAAIKSNGLGDHSGDRVYPDHCLVYRNTLHNASVRETNRAVTPIDVNGASDWVVRANLIADFLNGGGNKTSYGAFFKNNSRRAVFERNFVVCQMHLRAVDNVTVGLSFGGGGTPISTRRRWGEADPVFEHRFGVMRNNVILHCTDVGIYLARAGDSMIQNNTLFGTDGIDVRFAESTAVVANNLVWGGIRSREAATVEEESNREMSARQFERGFRNPHIGDFTLIDEDAIVRGSARAPEILDDFCGNPRSAAAPDVGAIEYSGGAVCDPSNRHQR